MPDAVSFVEVDAQHVELLPARTVMSLFAAQGGGGNGGTGGEGGSEQPGIGFDTLNANVTGYQTHSAGDAVAGSGGSANGGVGG